MFLTSEYICIAMEYATGGSLFHYVQKQGRLKVGSGGFNEKECVGRGTWAELGWSQRGRLKGRHKRSRAAVSGEGGSVLRASTGCESVPCPALATVLAHLRSGLGLAQEAVARWFFQQLIIGADYCHKRGGAAVVGHGGG